MGIPSPDKQALYARGILSATRFCEKNGFKVPEFINLDDPQYKRLLSYIGTCGFYRTNRVHVSVKLSAHRAGPKMCALWSYPRHKIDRTPCGVVAHEVGHHVDEMLKFPSRGISQLMKRKAVSGYEPNLSEVFAETMRLFILNPDLLAQGNPERYKFLRETLGLVPVVGDDWKTRLGKECPDRILAAAQKWINS